MEKIEGSSVDLTEVNKKIINDNFPEVMTEGKIDFEKLKLLLGEDVDSSDEKYQFTWCGKNDAIKLSQSPSLATLLPCKEKSVDWEKTQNLYIEGDNLEVLKLLQKHYYGKIDVIYIDPPYNTGNDFVYKDDFTDNIRNYKKQTKQECRANAEISGRYHTDWLNMIYPRLKLAKNLLTTNGIIFISIDDNEVEKMKMVCNEVFGEINFVGTFSVENNPKGRKNSKFISISSEYCLIYCRNKNDDNSYFIENIPKSENDMTVDENGEYIQSGGRRVLVGEQKFNELASYNSDKHYSVYYKKENNNIIIKKEKSIYEKNEELIRSGYKRYISFCNDEFVENTYTEKQFFKLFDEDNLIFNDEKIYEKNASTTIRIKSIITNKKYDAIMDNKVIKNYEIDVKTTSAGTRIKELFGVTNVPFSAPKNENFIALLLSLIDKRDFICLDFFAGSATTAHSVMNLNSHDKGNRRYIMVQLPENLEENLKIAKQTEKKNIETAINYLNNKKLPLLLTEISEERIRRAGKRIKEKTNADIDYGFKVFKLDTSNIKVWSPEGMNAENAGQMLIDSINPIVEGRTDEDLLYEIILKEGYELTAPVEKISIDDKNIYSVGMGYMVVMLDEINSNIISKIGEIKPQKVVFKDSVFKNENEKFNAIQELKKYGIEEKCVRSI